VTLKFDNILYSYGGAAALTGVSLEAVAGEVTCLLGPSGCGKTTLLKLAAGLLPMQSGQILLNGNVLANTTQNPPPERRPIGLVFQEGALFPHLTVRENIAFGINHTAGQSDLISGLLDQVGLTGFADRYPHTLSGGQQQRVALVRALAPEPDVLLLDEPFASVDIVLRRALREETREVLKQRGAVAILVTHDPDEAMEVADKIAVMDKGQIIQFGAPKDLYDHPVSTQVGLLIGGGVVIEASNSDGMIQTRFGVWPLNCLKQDAPTTDRLNLLIRPDALDVDVAGDNLVTDVRSIGGVARAVVMSPAGDKLYLHVPATASIKPGDKINIAPKPRAISGFAMD